MKNADELGAVLERERGKFANANPKSAAQYEAASAFPGGSTRSVLYYPPFPLSIAKGLKSKIWDVDGHEYSDFLNEYSAGLFGHSNSAIKDAIVTALEDGINLGGPNRYEACLASALTKRFSHMERIRFCNTGTEANIAAIQLALHVTNRKSVLFFKGGYHGGFIWYPNGGMPLNIDFHEKVAPFNDEDALDEMFALHGSEFGACIIEPVMSAGGAIPATRPFLVKLQAKCIEHSVILIFDEVVSSRLNLGGMQALHEIYPDITTLGKYIGGGLSFGAFGGRAELIDRLDMRRPDAVAHAGTFNNNVLSMAAGLAASTVLTKEAIDRINGLGDAAREQFSSISPDKQKMSISGQGSLSCVHFESKEVHDLYHLHLLMSGYYTARRGSVYLSLETTESEILGFLDATRVFVERFGNYL
ncbi:aminotransferase class III-fold pyridoxal phosphate-dependent enzyme [Phyllobacterium zundukense]|nr:aminotransferase class III-fold pyridoxal phosphate-dependent enzyme [Phyllobacterium zundukense]